VVAQVERLVECVLVRLGEELPAPSYAFSTLNLQREIGLPVIFTPPKPWRVRSASSNTATSISPRKTLFMQPMKRRPVRSSSNR
jgi:hypothetical protein